jgi:hypothetical protein
LSSRRNGGQDFEYETAGHWRVANCQGTQALDIANKTLVEFKLAKNSQLQKDLQHQAEIYQKASDVDRAIKVIIYFTAAEKKRVDGILKKLNLDGHKDLILIDARKDNKPSGSKARA